MKGLTVRRLALPLLAAVLTSAVVAAMAVGDPGKGKGKGKNQGPPNPSGQVAGELAINGKTIPILSYSAGASNPGSTAAGGGAGAGKVTFSSLNLIKHVDANSPALFSAVATGQHFAQATFTAQAGNNGASNATMTFKLDTVIVESVQQSGSGGEAPTESLALRFAKVTWTFTDASGTTSGSWNVATNSP
jgi:type VI secretion system secreted protein Hcp